MKEPGVILAPEVQKELDADPEFAKEFASLSEKMRAAVMAAGDPKNYATHVDYSMALEREMTRLGISFERMEGSDDDD